MWLSGCVTWGKYLFPHPLSFSFPICDLGILVVIEHVFIEGLLWQAMCWKLGMQRGVRLSQCPRVPQWLAYLAWRWTYCRHSRKGALLWCRICMICC